MLGCDLPTFAKAEDEDEGIVPLVPYCIWIFFAIVLGESKSWNGDLIGENADSGGSPGDFTLILLLLGDCKFSVGKDADAVDLDLVGEAAEGSGARFELAPSFDSFTGLGLGLGLGLGSYISFSFL